MQLNLNFYGHFTRGFWDYGKGLHYNDLFSGKDGSMLSGPCRKGLLEQLSSIHQVFGVLLTFLRAKNNETFAFIDVGL